MGWTGVSNRAGVSSLKMLEANSSYYKGSVWWGVDEQGNRVRKKEVEDMAVGTGGVYGILKVTELATGKFYRTALIILVQRERGEFLWKDMSEAECPNACGIPARLFNKLTPADEFAQGQSLQYILEWRAHAKNHLSKKTRVVEVGSILEFANPLRFNLPGGPVEVKLFKVRDWGRKKRFDALCADGTSFPCRLSRFALDSNYSVHA
jgi:hypothetical protein